VADFRLPELGENISAGDVLNVLVKVGDLLAKDQPVLELETDKATIEVPSSIAGKVTAIKVKAGDKVQVGQAILSLDDGGATAAPAPKGAPPAAAPPPVETTPHPLREAEGDDAPSAPPVERVRPSGDNVVDIARGPRHVVPPASGSPAAPAAPSVRRMARELGVNIDEVSGSGDGGRISMADVTAYAKRLITMAVPSAAGGAAAARPVGEPLPDFSRWGAIERQAMRGIRKKTAHHLGASWATIPLVTQYDLADITGFEEIRKRHTKQAGATAAPLTVTALAVKIVAAALKQFPQFNVSIDMALDEIIVKKYIHIGVAVDTDRGLLVPVVRNADTKNLLDVSNEVASLAERARSRRLTLDEMQGGTFSISNLGGIGGTSFTPLVNAPEVAILGISRARLEPVYKDGQFSPRLMLPLSLSYDHRAIDGADGARFLRWVADVFEQPFLLSLQG
jgi:pyruvate dehydrogenase E2 component (dihydrolipoamide acetyltransferase)